MEELRTRAKHLGQEEQYQLRKNIVYMLKKGMAASKVAEALDVSRTLVYTSRKAYNEKGIEGIKPGKRGRRVGEKRILTPQQEREVQGIIVDRHPEQMKLNGCMWTRENIRELIARKYKLEMGLSTLGYYLSRWGFSVQRPAKRARKQDEARVQSWMNEEYPAIQARAKEEIAEIYWGDETGVQNTCNYAKGYAPIGKTPTMEVESRKLKVNMLSAMTNRGKLRFLLYRDNMNSDKLIDFMRRLVKDTPKKVFLILDNLRVHHSKKVIEWLDRHKDQIEVFYLPPYAPEYNPTELCNSHLKRGIGNRPVPKSANDIESNIRSHMKRVQLNSKLICSFFQAKTTRYAA